MWDTILDWLKNNLSEWTMTKIYIGCAVAGGSVLLGQMGLTLFGIGDADDVDADVSVDDLEGADSLNFLSVRALAGFLTFFGLVGWGGTASHWHPGATIGAAFGSGAMVMVIIAVIMRFFARMHSEGNIQPENAVGRAAHVYLRVPGDRAGKGKISLVLQGRSMEFSATTAGSELPTGSECRILRMITDDTFEVGPLEQEKKEA